VRKHLVAVVYNGLKYDFDETCIILRQDTKKIMFSDYSVLDIQGTGQCIGQCISRKPHASNISKGDYLLSNKDLEKESLFKLFMKGPKYENLLTDPETLNSKDQQIVPFLLIEPTPQDSAEMDFNSVYLLHSGDLIIQDKQDLEHHYIHTDKNTEKLLQSFFGDDKDIFKKYLENKVENDNKTYLKNMGKLATQTDDTGVVNFIKNKLTQHSVKKQSLSFKFYLYNSFF
jgi:hypothetical protein